MQDILRTYEKNNCFHTHIKKNAKNTVTVSWLINSCEELAEDVFTFDQMFLSVIEPEQLPVCCHAIITPWRRYVKQLKTCFDPQRMLLLHQHNVWTWTIARTIWDYCSVISAQSSTLLSSPRCLTVFRIFGNISFVHNQAQLLDQHMRQTSWGVWICHHACSLLLNSIYHWSQTWHDCVPVASQKTNS